MKKFLLIVFVAVLGGLVALSGANYLGWGDTKYIELAENPVSLTKFSTAPDTRVMPAPSEGFVVAADRALPAVVHIKASKPAGKQGGEFYEQLPDAFRDLFGNRGRGMEPEEMPLQQGSGSGVIIGSDGYIVSNNHVVAGAETLEVVLNDERTYTAEVIGTDPTTDIALIKINETGLPTIKFADSDQVKIGEWVVAVGNPFSLTSTVTAGIVSAKGRSIDIVRRSAGDYAIESFIQTDAVVNPGNSGGALVNQNGDLIGINTAISSPTGVFAGYSFAVPSAIVKKVAEDLREYGVVQRGLLGAKIQQLNTASAGELDIDRNNGVYVSEVIAGSAAEDAGIETGDVIVAVDGVKTLRNSTLLEQLGRRRPGDKVTITVERDGNRKDITVQLKNSDGNTGVLRPRPEAENYASLGATFEDTEEGIVVTALGEGLLRDQTRLRPGNIVTKVNGRTVRSVKQLEAVMKSSTGAVAIEFHEANDPDRVYKDAFVQ